MCWLLRIVRLLRRMWCRTLCVPGHCVGIACRDQAMDGACAAPTAARWADAIKAYTDCLTLDPSNDKYNAKLYCNRAAALAK